MALPTCECVEAQPQIDKLKSIYCAVLELAGNDPSLPECGCPQTVNDLLNAIYCAILIWGGEEFELLASINISDPGNIASFSRAQAAGYSGSGDADAYQREAAVDVLRDSHFIGSTETVLLQDNPVSECVLVAPANLSATGGVGVFSASWNSVPVTVSLLRYEYRLDGAGAWVPNGTNLTLTNIVATAGSHTLNVRAVSTSGVAGDTATSGSFTVTPSTVTFTDTFNRANSDPMSTTSSSGGTWEVGPGAMNNLKIVSNASIWAFAGDCGARVSLPAFGATQTATITKAGADMVRNGPMVRMATAGNGSGYLLYTSAANTLQFYKITDSGTLNYAQLGGNITLGSNLVAGDTVGLKASGGATTTLEAFVNGVSQGTTTDSSSAFTTGQPGLFITGNAASDNPVNTYFATE
jgi:hypothetical protein